jgi:hypothetical protein
MRKVREKERLVRKLEEAAPNSFRVQQTQQRGHLTLLGKLTKNEDSVVGCDAASVGNEFPAFRDNVLVLYSTVEASLDISTLEP